MRAAGKKRRVAGAFVALGALLAASSVDAQSLKGSRTSLIRQRQWAVSHDFTFLRSPADVRDFVRKGLLVPLSGNRDYETHAVSFPYSRPEVRMFVERLAAQYRAACGEKLVVTSATRPITRQPRNASRLSTHPAGMAVDLRRSRRASCRSWLERVLLQLERTGVLEATREWRPPHYHVAISPQAYAQYVARMNGETEAEVAPDTEAVEVAEAGTEESGITETYQVRRGDSLWKIARRNGVPVSLLKEVNDIHSARIHPGQELVIATADGTVDDGVGQDAVARTYQVRRGDSLWKIARKTGVPVPLLKQVNGMRSTRIHPGQTLVIPTTDAG